MESWREVAARQHGAVRRGTRGLSRARADKELRSGGLARAGRHALVVTAAPESPARALWLVRAEIGDPMAFSGVAALSLYGVPVPCLPEHVEVCVPRHRTRRRVPGARIRPVVSRELARRRTADGLPVVSVPVAVRCAAAELPRAPYANVVEHVLRLRLTTEEQLRRVLGHGLVGAQALRSALAVVGADSHSCWERRLALLIRRAGLPRPRRQALVDRAPAYWVDFLFAEWGVAVEVDGFATHAQPDAFAYGLRRARRLRVRHGLDVLSYAPVEIRDDPVAVVSEIAELLRQRGARIGPLPRHFS